MHKTITPVVSVILLIMLTIVASAGAYFFINSEVNELQDSGAIEGSPYLDNSRLNLVSITGSQALVRNDGNSPVTEMIVLINGEALNYTLDSPIQPGEVREINYTSQLVGTDFEIKIYYNDKKSVEQTSPAEKNTIKSGFTNTCNELYGDCAHFWFENDVTFNQYNTCACCGDDLNEYFYNGTIGSTNHFCFNSAVINEEIDNNSDICSFYNYTWFNDSHNFIRTTYSMSPNPSELSSGDMDSDGDNDIVISGINSWLYIYKNYGNGTFYSQAYSKYVHAIHHLSDLDNDGDIDIAVVRGSTYNDLFFLQNDGNGNYVEINSTTVEGNPLNIKCADIDSDGDEDAIMISYYYFSIHENLGNGFLSNKTYFYDYGGQINSLGLGDINEDGYIDLIIGRWNQLIIYYNNGSGNFDTNMTINTYALLGSTHNFHSIYFYDIDKDSHNDILLPLYNSAGLFILYNNGSGNFSNTFYYSLPTTLDDLAIGDIDSDGYDDISLTGSGWPGYIYIMKNNGTGRNFSLYNTLITGNSPRDINILDFDNTSTLDIINANSGSGYSGFNYFSNVITLGNGKYCCGDDGVSDIFTNGTHSCCSGIFTLGSCI